MPNEAIDLATWKKLIVDPEAGVRADAADSLPKGNPTEVIPFLVACLNDSESLVRTCAADSLGLFDDDSVRQALRSALGSETDRLTRTYIYSSLGSVGLVEDLGVLVAALGQNTDNHIRMNILLGLLFCVQKVAVNEMLDLATGEDERSRVAAVNCLREYLGSNRSWRRLISETIAAQSPKEQLASHIEAIENLLKEESVL